MGNLERLIVAHRVSFDPLSNVDEDELVGPSTRVLQEVYTLRRAGACNDDRNGGRHRGCENRCALRQTRSDKCNCGLETNKLLWCLNVSCVRYVTDGLRKQNMWSQVGEVQTACPTTENKQLRSRPKHEKRYIHEQFELHMSPQFTSCNANRAVWSGGLPILIQTFVVHPWRPSCPNRVPHASLCIFSWPMASATLVL